MLPVLGMGVDVELVENVGPVIERPIRTAADVEALRVPDPEEAVPFILEAVRLVRAELEPEQALVGFCGGPFTVAGYLVEGKPTRDFVQTKRLMYGAPEVWHALMEKLTEMSIRYLRAKVEAGADVVQLFDSWIGALSLARLRRVRLAVLAENPERDLGADDPLRHRHAAPARDDDRRRDRHRLAKQRRRGPRERAAACRAISIRRCSSGRSPRVEEKTQEILTLAGGRPGHIFNLGHGVLPDTDPADLRRLVELVHERTATVAA